MHHSLTIPLPTAQLARLILGSATTARDIDLETFAPAYHLSLDQAMQVEDEIDNLIHDSRMPSHLRADLRRGVCCGTFAASDAKKFAAGLLTKTGGKRRD